MLSIDLNNSLTSNTILVSYYNDIFMNVEYRGGLLCLFFGPNTEPRSPAIKLNAKKLGLPADSIYTFFASSLNYFKLYNQYKRHLITYFRLFIYPLCNGQ